MKHVAFCGLKGSGKDTAADVLVAAGWHKIGMSDSIKQMMRGLLRYRGVPHREIERMLDGDLKRVASTALNGRTPTYAMQKLGTEWGRMAMADRFWLDGIDDYMRFIGDDVPITISGIRFHNERDWAKGKGFILIRIVRPDGTDPNDTHPSEVDIGNLKVDLEIHNENFATAADFQTFVAHVLRHEGILTA